MGRERKCRYERREGRFGEALRGEDGDGESVIKMAKNQLNKINIKYKVAEIILIL